MTLKFNIKTKLTTWIESLSENFHFKHFLLNYFPISFFQTIFRQRFCRYLLLVIYIFFSDIHLTQYLQAYQIFSVEIAVFTFGSICYLNEIIYSVWAIAFKLLILVDPNLFSIIKLILSLKNDLFWFELTILGCENQPITKLNPQCFLLLPKGKTLQLRHRDRNFKYIFTKNPIRSPDNQAGSLPNRLYSLTDPTKYLP